MKVKMVYDDIIVGAGSSGCVLAARLSEDPNRKVLLIEAGPYFKSEADLPQELLNVSKPVTKGFNWDFVASMHDKNMVSAIQQAGRIFGSADVGSQISMAKTAIRSTLSGNSALLNFEYPVGKVVGGSSSVNGGLAMRGTPQDYDAWAKVLGDSWRWEEVLQYFKKLENDFNCEGYAYGKNGPISIGRTPASDLNSIQTAFMDVCKTMRFPVGDHNDPKSSGLGIVPKNVVEGRRISTAQAYLFPIVSRQNLEVVSDVEAESLLVKSGMVLGVRSRGCEWLARRVVLAAGAINTPGILIRSGIGPVKTLEALGVKVEVGLSAVGQNLQDHAAVAIWGVPQDGLCKKGEDIHEAVLRFSSANSEHENDMSLYMLNSVETSQFPELKSSLGCELALALSAVLGKPDSRGRIEYLGKKGSIQTKIVLNCASTQSDMERLMEAVRLSWDILHCSPLREKVKRFFAWNQKIIDSDKLLAEAITTFVRGSWHAVGTARMGGVEDENSVVNSECLVHGFENLYIGDASVMPDIPSAPTNLTCVMIAEKLSDILRS